MTTLSERLLTLAAGKPNKGLKLSLANVKALPEKQRKAAIQEVWERFAPESWQDGCPHYLEDQKQPLPLGLSDLGFGVTNVLSVVGFLLENPQRAMTIWALLQEATTRMMAWDAILPNEEGRYLPDDVTSQPEGIAWNPYYGKPRDLTTRDMGVTRLLEALDGMVGGRGTWNRVERACLKAEDSPSVKTLGNVYDLMTAFLSKDPNDRGPLRPGDVSSLKNPYEPIARFPKGVYLHSFCQTNYQYPHAHLWCPALR